MEGMQSCNPRKRTMAGRLWPMSVKNVKVTNQARDPRWLISTEILGVSCVCVTETINAICHHLSLSLSLWFCWCCFHNSFVALCLSLMTLIISHPFTDERWMKSAFTLFLFGLFSPYEATLFHFLSYDMNLFQ